MPETTFKLERVASVEAPAVFAFEVPPNSQVAISHDRVGTGEIDPETGKEIMENTNTFIRFYMLDANAIKLRDTIQAEIK